MAPLAQLSPPSFDGPEARRISRTSMLVAASLRIADQAVAVRIRNISATGALIEGAVLPLPDCRIELVRGELRATGRVAWVDGNRCGITLDRQLTVDSWISGKVPVHQALVDAMADQARGGIDASPAAMVAGEEPASGIGRPEAAIGEEIDAIIASLAALGERLTDDPDVVARHMIALQAIDEAQQRLVALKRRLP